MRIHLKLARLLTDLGWKTKLYIFASLLAICTIAVGIVGALVIVYFNSSLQHTVGQARERAEVAAMARLSVVGIDRAQARLILAQTAEDIRREAIAAIRAASFLEESLQSLERTFPGNREVRELILLNLQVTSTRMAIIKAAKARNVVSASAQINEIAASISRIEELSSQIMTQQQAILTERVTEMSHIGDRALFLLVGFTAMSIALALLACSVFARILGKSIENLQQSEQRMRSHNHILELLARGAPLSTILTAILDSVGQETPGKRCEIRLTDAASNSGPSSIAPLVSFDPRWSEPIRDASGSALGTIFFDPSSTMGDADFQLIARAATLTGIAIERSRINEEQQLAASVYQNSSEAMSVTDCNGIILAVNPAFIALTGYAAEEVVGQNAKILSSGIHDSAYFHVMWDAIKTTGSWQGEIWNKRKTGEIYPGVISINSLLSEDGTVHRRVALFSDLSKKKEAEELIWKQANFDFLTKLPNRNMFHDRLEQEIKKADRTGLPMALLFLDLDHFKDVNDTLGHDMGDLLLKAAASRLQRCVRDTDTVARLGGDEFTIILGELKHGADITRIAQDIQREIAEPFQLGSETAFISTSIGITVYPQDGATIDALLKNADQAMYAAKDQGRNRFNYFTPTMQENAQSRMHMTSDLRSALAGRQFRLHYQPIVALATGAIDKAEALIRWHSPTRGLVNPAEFIPIAEKTKMIIAIGDWVFREAARQVQRLRLSHGPDFQVSVNVSPVQFCAEDMNPQAWSAHLQELGLPGKSIVLEITEGLLLDSSVAVTERLMSFRDTGIEFSLDDFGTGYSSLSYLKKFQIDFVKIDQSFVRNLAPGASDLALCEAIIVMSHKLGLKVIAEGVETQAQMDLLLAAGCDYGQGYLFSKPLLAAEFEAFLSSHRQHGDLATVCLQ
jgi:diguanylate cyclase (GGDEF)-like protein/PAS domain S-box-containing protein